MTNFENRGINFRNLIPQLSTTFKVNVAEGKVNLSSVFNLSEQAEDYFRKLIIKDVDELSLKNVTTEQPKEQPINNLLTTIKNKLWQR